MKEYALYKGDECLGIGSLKELAEKFKVKYKTMYFYTTPVYKKRSRKGKNRRILVKV